ncbi:hypothetical protein M885DRAFT_625949 [Pelagophyceae sp. CCMP2097]|nr:hypothetical protein M885DRAFT_625949 [Pelagophyceae sp. CCMP2097]
MERPRGVWALICGVLSPVEVPEVLRAVGEAAVRQSDDLHNEAEALRDIVGAYADEQGDLARAAAPRPTRCKLVLDDGPERDMLERKIGLLLEYLDQQGGGASGGAPPAARRHDDRLAKYIRGGGARSQPDGSGDAKSDDNDAPQVTTPRQVTAEPPRRGPSDRALALRKVSIETLDDVVDDVRSLLAAEAAELLAEIDALTASFDAVEVTVSSSRRADDAPAEDGAVSLSELRSFGKELEAEWLQQEHANDVRGVLAKAAGSGADRRRPTSSPKKAPLTPGAAPDEPVDRFSRSAPLAPRARRPGAAAPAPLADAPPPPLADALPPPRFPNGGTKSKLRARLRDARDQTLLNEW